MDATTFLTLVRTPKNPHIYIVGCFDKRVTVYSQQVRALNVIWALAEGASLGPSPNIAIVGGGIAGLTAAAAALKEGWRVTIFERQKLLHMQADAQERWIHPHIIDWPDDGADNAGADLEFLDWCAGIASQIIADMRIEWDTIRAKHDEKRCTVHEGADVVKVSNKSVQWVKNGKAKEDEFDAVVLTVGFGLEEGKLVKSYWRNDGIRGPQPGSGKRYLISGCGDGGLIDFLRLRLEDSDHDSLARRLCAPERTEIRDKVRTIEETARAHYHGTPGDEKAQMAAASAYLKREYRNLIASIDDATRREILGAERSNAEVILNDHADSYHRLNASPFNRFLVALLEPQFREGEAKIKKVRDGHSVQFSLSDGTVLEPEHFDEIIIRRGPKSALQHKELKRILKAWQSENRGFGKLDITRQRLYGDRWKRSARTSSTPAPTTSADPDAEPAPPPFNDVLARTHRVDFLIIAPHDEDRDALLSRLPNAEHLSSSPSSATYHGALIPRDNATGSDRWVALVIVTATTDASIRDVVNEATKLFNPQCVLLVGALDAEARHRAKPGDVIVSRALIPEVSWRTQSPLRKDLSYGNPHSTVPWLFRAVRKYERAASGARGYRIRIGDVALGAIQTVESIPEWSLGHTLVCDPVLAEAAGPQMSFQYAQGVNLAIRGIAGSGGVLKSDASQASADVALGVIRAAIAIPPQLNATPAPTIAAASSDPFPLSAEARRFRDHYRLDTFAGRDVALKQLHDWQANTTGPRCAMVHAPAGRGKSALLVRFYDALIAQGRTVCFFPISLRFGTDTERAFWQEIARFFASLHSEQPPTNMEPLETLRERVSRGYMCRELPSGVAATLIVDGIDETSNWKVDRYTFPAPPPKGLSILVSVRAQHDDPLADRIRLQIGWNQPDQASFVKLEPLRPEDVKAILEESSEKSSRKFKFNDSMAKAIHERSEGDPLLVQLYAHDLAEGREITFANNADAHPTGLRGYLTDWWEHQEKLWGNDAARNRQAAESVMSVLAMARGPMTRDDISALSDRHNAREITTALKDLRRLVLEVGESTGNQKPKYVFHHIRLAWYYREEYLDPEERDKIENQFLDYGKRLVDAILAKDNPSTTNSAYIVRFYGLHLEQAVEKRWNGALDSLVRLCDPKWMRASREIDPSLASFAADADRAFEALLKAENRRFQAGEALAYISQTIRALFCAATARRTMATMPHGLVGQLVERGIWSTQAGLALAKTSSERTSDILYEIAPYLSAAEIDEALDIALAQQTVDALQRATQLLAPHLSDLQIQRARSAIAERPNAQNALKILDEHLAPPFGATAPELPNPAPPIEKPTVDGNEPAPSQASNTMNASTAEPILIDPRSSWLKELAEIASRPVDRSETYRLELLRLVRNVQSPWGDDLAADFAQALERIQQPDHRLAACVESVEYAGNTIPDTWFVPLLEVVIRDAAELYWIADYRAAIRRFIRALPAHCLASIESTIRSKPRSAVTLAVLTALVPRLNGDRGAAIWEEVVDATESNVELAYVLMRMADELPPALLPRALNVARKLDYPLGKAKVLVELANRNSSPTRESVLFEALAAAELPWTPVTDDPNIRVQLEQSYKQNMCETILHIAHAFPAPIPPDVLRRSFRHLQGYLRGRGLLDDAALAVGAPPSKESLNVLREYARTNLSPQARAEWLAGIVSAQREEERDDIIREAIDTAQTVGDAQPVLSTITSLLKLISASPQLSDAMLAKIMTISEQIEDHVARMYELVRLWPLVSPSGQKLINEKVLDIVLQTGQCATPDIVNVLQICDTDQKKKITQRVVDQICSLPPGVSNEPGHARQLSIVGSSLGFDEVSFRRGLVVAEKMNNIEYQAKTLAALAAGRALSVATNDAWNAAFLRTCDLARKAGNASGLAWLATAAEEPLCTELANDATVTFTGQTFDAKRQQPTTEEAALVVKVASDESLPAVLAKVFEISDPSWRNSCLRETIIGVTGKRQQHVLEIVLERFRTTTSTERRRFYTQIATVLPDVEIEPMLAEPSEKGLNEEIATADFIQAIAYRLTESQRRQAVHVIGSLTQVQERPERMNALVALASHPSIASEVRAELFTEWRNQLKNMRSSDRVALLSHFEGSAPLIAALGGEEALRATAEGLLQVQAGWDNA